MILKSFEFQCDLDFDFQITTSKMIWILILNHLYLGDLILILKSSTLMILPISADTNSLAFLDMSVIKLAGNISFGPCKS